MLTSVLRSHGRTFRRLYSFPDVVRTDFDICLRHPHSNIGFIHVVNGERYGGGKEEGECKMLVKNEAAEGTAICAG